VAARSKGPFEKQLFAISGVSGGALGAVFLYATMADSQQNLQPATSQSFLQSPCKVNYSDSDWFGPSVNPDWAPSQSWRGCLQLIAAGDFLSPVFANLLNPNLLSNGATVLEQAWERRYEEMTGRATIADPLLTVRSRVLKSDAKNWLPILLLNGTSVE